MPKSYMHGGTHVVWNHVILDEDGDVVERQQGGVMLPKVNSLTMEAARAQYDKERRELIDQFAAENEAEAIQPQMESRGDADAQECIEE